MSRNIKRTSEEVIEYIRHITVSDIRNYLKDRAIMLGPRIDLGRSVRSHNYPPEYIDLKNKEFAVCAAYSDNGNMGWVRYTNRTWVAETGCPMDRTGLFKDVSKRLIRKMRNWEEENILYYIIKTYGKYFMFCFNSYDWYYIAGFIKNKEYCHRDKQEELSKVSARLSIVKADIRKLEKERDQLMRQRNLLDFHQKVYQSLVKSE